VVLNLLYSASLIAYKINQFLAFIRLSLFSIGIFLIFRRLSLKIFNYALSIVYILTISYTLTKILLFSEHEEQLKYPGIWLSVWLTLVFSTTHFLLWFFVIQKHKRTTQEDDGYTQMAENGHVTGTNLPYSAPLLAPTQSETDTPNAETPKLDRVTAMNHIRKIFKFTAIHWPWFAAGFVCLLIYSGGNLILRDI
jgi:hypothetical protein